MSAASTRNQLFHLAGDLRSGISSRAANRVARHATRRVIVWLALAGDGKAVVRGQDQDLDPVVGGYEVIEIPKRGEVRIGWVSINDPPTPEHIVRK